MSHPSVALCVRLYKKQFCGLVSRALNWELKLGLVAVFAIDFGDRNMDRLLWAMPGCELPVCHPLLSNAPLNKLLSCRKAKEFNPLMKSGGCSVFLERHQVSMAELQPWAGGCTRVSHPQVLFCTATEFPCILEKLCGMSVHPFLFCLLCLYC